MLTFVSVTDEQVREIIEYLTNTSPSIITRDAEHDTIEVQVTTVWDLGDENINIDDYFTLSKTEIESETGFPLTAIDQRDYQKWLVAVKWQRWTMPL